MPVCYLHPLDKDNATEVGERPPTAGQPPASGAVPLPVVEGGDAEVEGQPRGEGAPNCVEPQADRFSLNGLSQTVNHGIKKRLTYSGIFLGIVVGSGYGRTRMRAGWRAITHLSLLRQIDIAMSGRSWKLVGLTSIGGWSRLLVFCDVDLGPVEDPSFRMPCVN